MSTREVPMFSISASAVRCFVPIAQRHSKAASSVSVHALISFPFAF